MFSEMRLAGRAKWLFNYISNSCLLIFFWFLAWKYKIMSCFCEMFERQKYGKALFFRRGHCQSFSQSQSSEMIRVGFEPTHWTPLNIEHHCTTAVKTTTTWHQRRYSKVSHIWFCGKFLYGQKLRQIRPKWT